MQPVIVSSASDGARLTDSTDMPVSVQFDFATGIFAPHADLSERRLSDLKEMYYDQDTVAAMIGAGNPIIYEIRYHPFVTSVSDMGLGVTRIFPGKVGDEYHMTKGHFHERPDQPEIYFCVRGEGYLLLETREGDFEAVPWQPGTITHIPPQWAHRVVNTGTDTLVFVASYHLAAGHDYAPVLARGFAQVVVARNNAPALIPNPRRR
jgi:glucose-6-phosphate isomerase